MFFLAAPTTIATENSLAAEDSEPLANDAQSDSVEPLEENVDGDATGESEDPVGGQETQTGEIPDAVNPPSPAPASAPFDCSPGVIYSISDGNAQLQKISDHSPVSVDNVGEGISIQGVADYNGLGMSPDGQHFYAYGRFKPTPKGGFSGARFIRFDTTANRWIDTGEEVDFSPRGLFTQDLVVGAVSPKDPNQLIFGGYDSTGLKLFSFDYSTAKTQYLGYIKAPNQSTDMTGDIVFDSVGNLYALANSRGNSGRATIYSAQAKDIAAAGGGEIHASPGVVFSANYSVFKLETTGIAFDAGGYLYLGNGRQILKAKLPVTVTSGTDSVVNNLTFFSDIASCADPAPPQLWFTRTFLMGGNRTPTNSF